MIYVYYTDPLKILQDCLHGFWGYCTKSVPSFSPAEWLTDVGSPLMSILVVFSGGFRQFLPVKTVYLVSGAGFNCGRGIGRNYQILWEELERASPFVWGWLWGSWVCYVGWFR